MNYYFCFNYIKKEKESIWERFNFNIEIEEFCIICDFIKGYKIIE